MSWDLYVRAILYLLLVLGLVVLCTWLVRLYGGQRLAPRGTRRLRLVETLTIDPRRRLIAVRWDDREHLILLGASGDLLVASRAAAEESAPLGEFARQLPPDIG